MSHIKRPRKVGDILKEKSGDLPRYFGKYKAVDEKGRYLHWHDIRHRVQNGDDAELAWAVIKLSRQSLLKPIELNAETGHPFQFCLPDSSQNILHKIDRLNAEIGANLDTARTRASDIYLVESLMMEEAISSAQLEGAATTRKVAKEMLEKERPPVNDDERMIVNNFILMKQAKYNKDQPLTIELIRRFHTDATRGVEEEHSCPGEIRKSNDIYVKGRDEEIAHQPPDQKLLLFRLEMLCDFANTNHDGEDGRTFIHPAVKAIILHFMIGYEHPFNDGNGRTARCLFYWYMLKSGYWAFEYISISNLLKQAPTQYGESYLFTENDDFDLTYFICYQLRIIERAINDFLTHIETKKKEFYEIMAFIDQAGYSKDLSFRQIHLLKKVLRNPGRVFTAKEVKNEFDVSEGTARADLEKLASLKFMAKTKEGKSYLYVARSDAQSRIAKSKVSKKRTKPQMTI
ncbi:Fic family protein [Pseudomonas oryzihabitans]|uniref:Fic family protein n=1 Tax=Pseudomonas oryzihabitans TaxID=47885 RepID=UPI0009EA408D|nr:Fic family protein [Pseudomonas oryzihabitans]